MGEISLTDTLEAAKLVAKTYLYPSDDLRVTPIRYRLVRHLAAGDVPEWIDFDCGTRTKVDALANVTESDPPNNGARRVGVVALNRDNLLDEMSAHSDVRLGLVRAVGTAVVFGLIPQHALPHDGDSIQPDYMFGVRLGADALPVLPVLRSADGSMRVPDANVAPLGIAAIDAVPATTRVY